MKLDDAVALLVEVAGLAVLVATAFMIDHIAGWGTLGVALILVGEFAFSPPKQRGKR